MNLLQVLNATAHRRPLDPAIVDGPRVLSYAELSDQVTRLARGLDAAGISADARIVIVTGNSVDAVLTTLAASVSGRVAVPLNPRTAPTDILAILAETGAEAVVHDDPAFPATLAAAGGPPSVRWIAATAPGQPDVTADSRPTAAGDTIAELIAAGGPQPLPELPDPDAIACLLYTSGTTGRPKALAHTHRHVWARILATLMYFGPPAEGSLRALGLSPLFHITGLHNVLWLTIAQGGSYHLASTRSTEATLDVIAEQRITYLMAAPTLLERWVGAAGERTFADVNLIIMGSAPRPPELVRRLRGHFPSARLAEAYGTTEGVFLGSMDLEHRPGAFQALGDLQVRVIKPGGAPDDLVADGEPGELIANTDSERVVGSFWRNPEADRLRYRDGWAYTGDGFRRDADGSLWVSGRLDDMFISGGENIQPAEVEDVLRRHPAVAEAAVLGLPDSEWGEVCTAFVVLSDGAVTAEDLDAHCRASADLAAYKRPRRFVVCAAIPRNGTGKIVRRDLRERYLAGQL
jgi:acyl-CoA synthetase (AMP-forming)/AMP-acid ligase II